MEIILQFEHNGESHCQWFACTITVLKTWYHGEPFLGRDFLNQDK